MSCSNCFNGCAEIISDKCVKYTGVDIELLGIKKGDSLSYVEQTLIGFLTSILNGEGVVPVLDPNVTICPEVTEALTNCGDVTLNDWIEALVTVVCNIEAQLVDINAAIAVIEAPYTIGACLTSQPDAGTHVILQEVIDQLCSVTQTLTALAVDVETNYVALADLNALIQSYLDSIAATDLMCNKMVPYSVVEYYGNLSNYPTVSDGFAVDGAGYGAWANVYLCNGNNGTPDKRGRVGVGDTVSMGGTALDADRAAFPYTKGVAQGVNTITLTETQMPTHTHTATPVVTDSGHYHFEFADIVVGTGDPIISATLSPTRSVDASDGASDLEYEINGTATPSTLGKSSSDLTNISVAVTNADAGSNGAHNNFQPGIGCYYIMYIP